MTTFYEGGTIEAPSYVYMPSTAALKVMMQSATSDQPKIRRKADHSGYVTPLGVMPPVTTISGRNLPSGVQGSVGGVEAPHPR